MPRIFLVPLLTVPLLLAGCSHTPAPDAAPAYAPLTSMRAVPADCETTARYTIDISYPLLPEAATTLATALQQTGASARQAFLQAVPDADKYPQLADRQYQLKIDFKAVTRSPRFISVREKGWANTGGAHPIPIDAALVYDRLGGQLLGLADLFANPQQALAQLARHARSTLQQRLLADMPGDASAQARAEWLANMRRMIRAGTEPKADNYRSFIILTQGGKATGLRLVFSPYQVAPYVYGTQTVDIPVAVFADLLRPEYRGAFTTARQ